MEPDKTLGICSMLNVTPQLKSLIRQIIDLDEDEIQKSIDAIKEWWKKEEHLVEALPHLPRSMIERFIIISQGSVEFSKRRIEKFVTTRGLLPELVLNKSYEEFKDIVENIYVLVLPKLNTKDHTRVTIVNIVTENYQDFNLLTLVRFMFYLAEYRVLFDYISSDRYILDMKNFKASMLTRLNPIILKKGEILVMDIYGIKVKGIHIVNAPPYVDKFISVLKQILKEKIANRVHVHKSYEDLYEEFSKDVLPEDYGGNAPSCKELQGQWNEYFKSEESNQIIEASNKIYSNESKRSDFKFNEEYLGMPGSFKQFNID